jgi:ABC-2 type transport system ATP-binding protein
MTAAQRRCRCDEVLDQAGLAEVRNLALRKFSKGMLQRIGIAQAVLHHPDLVLLDEPMSGLDPVGRREVRNLIVRLKAEGKTVFFSTHILADAEALCDRVAILNRGQLAGVGQIAELLRRHAGYEAVVECSARELLPRLQALASQPLVATGGHYRLEIPENRQGELLSLCSQGGLRLVSLNSIRSSLEDYFVEMLQPAQRVPEPLPSRSAKS